MRNFLLTLFVSQGIPMILMGDEYGHTRNGNNNPYAQDNPTSWLDWTHEPEADALLALVRSLTELRRRSPVLRQRAFFDGRPVPVFVNPADPADAVVYRDMVWGNYILDSLLMLLLALIPVSIAAVYLPRWYGRDTVRRAQIVIALVYAAIALAGAAVAAAV